MYLHIPYGGVSHGFAHASIYLQRQDQKTKETLEQN